MTSVSGSTAGLDALDLHSSLSTPTADAMNFLNEIALQHPEAISFAAGRPYEGFFDTESVHRYLRLFTEYLRTDLGHDEQTVRRTLLQYGRTKGIIHELVARHLAVDEGIEVDPEAVVVTVGFQEALFLVLRALRGSDQDVIVSVLPTYVGLLGAAGLVDMPVLGVRSGRDGVDLAHLAEVLALARASGRRPRALYVNPDFANPTGTTVPLEARAELLRLAGEQDLLVLEDNAYSMFYGDGEPLPSLKAMDRDRRVVRLGSFAKTGVAGARVGYVVADQPVVGPRGEQRMFADELAKIKSMLTVNTSPLAQAVIGGKLLAHGCSLRAANVRERRVYQESLAAMLRELAGHFPRDRYPDLTWNSPAGGFFLTLSVPFPADDALLERCAEQHRVLWTPLNAFYGDRKPRNEIRLSFSHLRPDEIRDGMVRFAAFVAEQTGRTRPPTAR